MKKNLELLFFRERILESVRIFFHQKNFHEIVSPVFNDAIPLESNIYPFETSWTTTDGQQKFFLSTSPEKSLKKALAMGMGNCFSIGHSFRNVENSGSFHQPEFLMLEWYRENATYKEIMDDVKELVLFLSQESKKKEQWPTLSLVQLFQQYVQMDLTEIIDDNDMIQSARKRGYETEGAEWDHLFNQIFLNEIEQHLPKAPFFLIDFPARMSPLCQPQKDQPELAERFEFFLNGIEIANGNTENTDAEKLKKHFAEVQRHAHQQQPIDEDFLNSLHQLDIQKKPYAGVGLGIDRLAMIFAKAKDIQSLTMFVG